MLTLLRKDGTSSNNSVIKGKEIAYAKQSIINTLMVYNILVQLKSNR